METLMNLFGFVMITLGFGFIAYIIYIPFATRIKNPDVLWFVRSVLIILWVIASFAIGFRDFIF